MELVSTKYCCLGDWHLKVGVLLYTRQGLVEQFENEFGVNFLNFASLIGEEGWRWQSGGGDCNWRAWNFQGWTGYEGPSGRLIMQESNVLSKQCAGTQILKKLL
jgi:hypothetical protein